jgi:putative ABC transport system permease protein
MIRRFREIGVLRAIGARRRQVAAMALVEALTLVAVAFVLALPLGIFIGRPLIATLSTGFSDLGVHYRYPWQLVPVLGLVGLAMGAAASVWPARRAARLEVDAALRFD